MIPIIADAGSNHNGNIERAVRLIEAAKSAGCQAVKFQMFNGSLSRSASDSVIYAMRALPAAWLPRLREESKRFGIKLHMTVTSAQSVSDCRNYVDALKIGSYEILCTRLIHFAAKQGLPISISTGGATYGEVQAAITACVDNKSGPIELYHCVPQYPAKPNGCDLERIPEMQDIFRTLVGWSDHTVKIGVICGAVAQGATSIELHIDLDGLDGWESQYGHCWSVSQVKQLQRVLVDMNEAVKEECTDVSKMRIARTDPIDGKRPLRLTSETV